MKKNSPIVKVLLVAGIVTVLGFFGLDKVIPKSYIEDAVDEQFASMTEDAEDVEENTTLTPSKTEWSEVVSVIDGDTFKVLMEGKVFTVRVLGIDTPETKYSDRGEECYGEEASREATLLLEDTKVSLVADSTQDDVDKYGRLLRYVGMTDGRDFGEVMIQNGFAEAYAFAGYFKNQEAYKIAEEYAKEKALGLWSCE